MALSNWIISTGFKKGTPNKTGRKVEKSPGIVQHPGANNDRFVTTPGPKGPEKSTIHSHTVKALGRGTLQVRMLGILRPYLLSFFSSLTQWIAVSTHLRRLED